MEDRKLITTFLEQVYGWLAACYSSQTSHASYYPVIRVRQQLQPDAQKAWEEFTSSTPLRDLLIAVNRTADNELWKHGLIGAQLRYKLKTIDFAREQVLQGIFGGWKRKLLELIDNLLESILSALGVGEALKELKDALVASLPDDDE